MTAMLTLPHLDQLKDYMRFSGWYELPPGVGGSLWISDGGAEVGLPLRSDVDDMVLTAAIERVARAEGRKVQQVSSRARHLWTDITRLRIANDSQIGDSIPLSTASVVVEAARRMFRAAGTTAVYERAEISRYNDRGDAVARQSRMAHTEQGSFVIPILTPLEPSVQPAADDTLFSHDPPEPFERRVVRTFAQSMHALRELVVEPAREPTPDTLLAMVERGVSREFCRAVGRILGERPVEKFESRVEWATALDGPAQIRSVIIGRDAAQLIERTADLLRANAIEPRSTFHGQIVGLHRSEHAPFGDIYVFTVRKGHPCEIRIKLPAEDYIRAMDWHRDHRPVIVEGAVEKDSSRKLFVSNLVRCHPLDETQLPFDTIPTPMQPID